MCDKQWDTGLEIFWLHEKRKMKVLHIKLSSSYKLRAASAAPSPHVFLSLSLSCHLLCCRAHRALGVTPAQDTDFLPPVSEGQLLPWESAGC